MTCRRRVKAQTRRLYLHDVHSHALRGHALHVVDQPMNDLRADKAVERQAFLLWEQLYTCPVTPKKKRSPVRITQQVKYAYIDMSRCQ